MNPFVTLPATCELCGNWLPGHSSSCPRNGVHPSQWSFDIIDINKNYLDSNNNCHSLHNYIVSSDENDIVQYSKHVFSLLEEEKK